MFWTEKLTKQASSECICVTVSTVESLNKVKNSCTQHSQLSASHEQKLYSSNEGKVPLALDTRALRGAVVQSEASKAVTLRARVHTESCGVSYVFWGNLGVKKHFYTKKLKSYVEGYKNFKKSYNLNVLKFLELWITISFISSVEYILKERT